MIAVLLATVAYFLAAGRLCTVLRSEQSQTDGLSTTLNGLAAGFHGYCLYLWIDNSVVGQNLSVVNIISLLIWLMGLLLLLLAWRRSPVAFLQLLLAPLAIISVLLAYYWPTAYVVQAGESHNELGHILISLLAFAVLIVTGLQALLLTLQHQLLRQHRHSRYIMRLPAVETMERLLFRLIAVGFFLLSASLLSGFAFFYAELNVMILQKVGLASVAWAIFAVLLWGRWRFGWRGQRAVTFTLLGLMVLLASYFGSRLLLG